MLIKGNQIKSKPQLIVKCAIIKVNGKVIQNTTV